MKTAIVLSGGGAKGSYQIGVFKALKKLHINYNIITGTSVGAINGAIMVQKSYRRAIKVWKKLNYNMLFNEELKKDYSQNDLIKMYGANILLHGGMDVTKLEELLRKYIKPKKFFASSIDYGLMTYNVSTHKAKTLTKKDLNASNLVDYIIASSTCFPAFKKKKIEEEDYIDGGYYDNLPINLAVSLGADKVIAVDLKAIGFKQNITNKNIDITYIEPKNDLCSILTFDSKITNKAIKYGYNDTLKVFNKKEGNKFTFNLNSLEHNYKKYIDKLTNNLNFFIKESSNNKLLRELSYFKVSNKLKKNDINEIVEYLGKVFTLDDSKIYNIKRFNKLLIKELKKTESVDIKDVLNNNNLKDFISKKNIIKYIYDNMTNDNKTNLVKTASIDGKDFLASLYLYTISSRW